MNKDMLNGWIAKAGEHKIAIGVAAVCTIAILASLLWPSQKPQAPIRAVKTAPATSPAFTPPTPAQPSTPAAATPAPQPAPAIKQAAPASTPAPAAPSTMQKELDAKPLFPSSSQPSAPKAAAPAPQPAPKPAPTAKPPAPSPKPARAASPRPVPVATIPAGYYVQLGSFKNKDGAAELAKKAASKHWSVYVAPRPGGLHAVWVGPYRTRAEADKAKQQLHKDMGISGFDVHSR